MKTLYLDIFSGLSGDMFNGAMIALGVSTDHVTRELKKLPVSGYHIHAYQATKSHISGIKFDVHCHDTSEHGHDHSTHSHSISTLGTSPIHEHSHSPGSSLKPTFNPLFPIHEQLTPHSHPHRTFTDIRLLIDQSALSDWVKKKSIAVFRRIAVAEGRVHGVPAEEVHFHEVGAVDSIVDIIAACVCIEELGHPRILASGVVEGTGWIQCAHGRFPIPSPATLGILTDAGIAVTQCKEENELVTPTGAALLAEFVEIFGPMQNLVPEKIGYGLGTRDTKTRPNVVRAILGQSQLPKNNGWETDSVAILETNLDDINPEVLGYFVDQVLESGALDVFHTPVQMKKNRPGVLLTVLCKVDEADKYSEMILRQTSAFGLRQTIASRRKLLRERGQVTTAFGNVEVKIGKLGQEIIRVTPEFESCKSVASETDTPLAKVYEAVIHSLGKTQPTQ